MPMTMSEFESVMDGLGLKYERRDQFLISKWSTDTYVDPDTNKKALTVFTVIEENGELISFIAPAVFRAKGRHVDDFLRACAMVHYKMKLMRLSYDASDGEVRAGIQLPLEDGTATPKQIRRCFSALVDILDAVYPTLQTALTKGKINFPE